MNRIFAATANRIGTENREGLRLSYIGQSEITSVKGRDSLSRFFG